MIALLMLPFLFGDFVQKWYFPQGVSGFGNTVIQILDTDRDGNLEFAFTTYGSWPPYIYIYELHLPDIWQADSIPLVGGDLLWDSGDFDSDGLYDLALDFHIENPSLADGIMIFESPDPFSYPTQEVWRDTVGPPLVMPISSFDIDRDGYLEIVKMGGDIDTAHYTDFLIYETVGNNVYSVKYTIATATSPTSTVAFGDFDQDTFNEFAMGTIDGEYSVFESSADDTYEPIILNQQLPTLNIKDCFSIPDADGDGKMEFVVKGFVVPTARIHAFIFEATGDNTYEIIKSFDLFGGHNSYYGGYSDVGDVDGDGVAEIVLEGCQTVHVIKATGNDSFYVWQTLPGNVGGSSVRVFDIDGNGLSEVIISGDNQTRIYEYQVGIAETTVHEARKIGLVVLPNPFRNQTNIRYSVQDSRYRAQNSTLRIYDACGRLVRSFSLVPSIQNQESCMVWHGDDEHGKTVAPGVYFVRFETPDQSVAKQIVILR